LYLTPLVVLFHTICVVLAVWYGVAPSSLLSAPYCLFSGLRSSNVQCSRGHDLLDDLDFYGRDYEEYPEARSDEEVEARSFEWFDDLE